MDNVILIATILKKRIHSIGKPNLPAHSSCSDKFLINAHNTQPYIVVFIPYNCVGFAIK